MGAGRAAAAAAASSLVAALDRSKARRSDQHPCLTYACSIHQPNATPPSLSKREDAHTPRTQRQQAGPSRARLPIRSSADTHTHTKKRAVRRGGCVTSSQDGDATADQHDFRCVCRRSLKRRRARASPFVPSACFFSDAALGLSDPHSQPITRTRPTDPHHETNKQTNNDKNTHQSATSPLT